MQNIIELYKITEKNGNKDLRFLIVFISLALLAAPVYASEDGDYYNDKIDFSFDDETGWADIDSDFDDVPDETLFGNEEDDTDNKIADNKIFLPGRPQIVTKSTQDDDNVDDDISNTPVTATLTEHLKKSPGNKNDNILEGTWVEKLKDISPSKLLNQNNNNDDETDNDADNKKNNDDSSDTVENMMKSYRRKSSTGRSNAAIFDISGVMLRMNVEQVEDVLTNRGFKKINARLQIPNFIKWRNEETCRISGVVGYERTQACVVQKAKKDGFEYIEYLKFAKFETKEEIEVYFTSRFTNNKVYKIEYKSTIAGITGNSPKATYLRNLKVYDFWRRINRKYGEPDDKTRVTWGLGGSKPYLKASTGWLKLEDPMFVEADYTKMSREDQRFINSDFYNF